MNLSGSELQLDKNRKSAVMQKLDLIIIGTQKAGTSSLFRLLGQHPEINSHITGEIGFFIHDNHYNQGYEKMYNHYFSETDHNKIALAKNVGIFESEKALERLKDHNPHAKIIVILRNPADRAYSAFWYMKSIGAERAERFEDIYKTSSAERFPGNDFMIRSCDYVQRGNYYDYLQTVEKYFDRKQIKVINFNDFKKDAVAVCENIFQFAELKPFQVKNEIKNKSKQIKYVWLASLFGVHSRGKFKDVVSRIVSPEMRLKVKTFVERINMKDLKIPKMDPQIKEELNSYYQDANRKLQEEYKIEF